MPIFVRASNIWEEAAHTTESRAIQALREEDDPKVAAAVARWMRALGTTFRARAQLDGRELDNDATPRTVVLGDPDPTEPGGQPK